jgi:PKD repeat protein
MRLRDYFDQIRRSSSGTLVALAAVVVVWIVVLAMIIAGIVFYFERPNLAQPGTPTAQTIAVEPTAGPAGTTVTVTGQGWAADSIISIYLLAPGQTQIPNFATAQATVDAQGQFATTVAIPLEGDWLAPGTAQVIAEVAGGGASARTIFVVLPTTPTPSAQPPIGTETPALTETPTPVPTPTGTPTPIPTPTPGPPTATANTAVNVRLGPGTNYAVIGTLLAGQSAGITGVSPDGAWWQISFAGRAGWVSSFYVLAQNTQNVPVVTPPPLPPTPTPVPQAPVAVIGIFNQGPTGQVITFDGSGSRASPGHNLVAFAWNFGDGTTANGVTVTHSYSQPGNYVVTLTVTDDQGLTAEATQAVQFQQLPPIPIIGGPSQGTVGDSVTFDGSPSIANTGIIVAYEWNFGDGTTANGVTVDHTYDQPGRYRVVLTTINSAGLSASADHDIRIEGQPTAIINAPSRGQVGQVITFYGSSSKTGDIVSFAWNFGDGTYANGQTVTHVYAQPGSFVVTLTVTDRRGLSDTATQTIYISQVLQAPTAIIQATNQGPAGQPVTFDGNGSTPGSGQIVSYAWSFGDGATASGPVVTHVYAQPGTYTIVLNVTNSNNLTAAATETIAIGQAAQPPTAAINAPAQGTEGQPVTFDGSGSTPGSGQIVRYEWRFGDGAAGSGATVSHTYARAGNYTVTLRVTNSSNLNATATHTIAIGQAAQPPTAVVNAPAQGTEGQPVSFDGSGSTPGSGQIVRYEWRFGDGAAGSGATVSHTYTRAGNYTVTLRVTNSSNLSATATHTIRVAGGPPNNGNQPGGENPPGGGQGGLRAVISAPRLGRTNQPITFDGSRSTANGGQIASYAWNFGDGTTGSGATVSHAYTRAGLYSVTLTVTDNRGQNAMASRDVIVP